MTRIVPPALLLLAAACSQPVARQPAVENAWVRLPAVPGRPGAAYFTLTGANAPARLVALESASVERIEMHETMHAGGHMAMRPLDGVNLPPRAPVPFRPGGRHAMLFGIAAAVKSGDTLPIGFRFADGTRIVAQAKVVGAGDAEPAE